MTPFERLRDVIAGEGAAALVTVHRVKGSAPREAGARMVVRPDGAFHGTIGGGRLEWETLREARSALAGEDRRARFLDQALGPDLGQCCGGVVTLLVETFDSRDAEMVERLARTAAAGETVHCYLGADGRVERRAHATPAGQQHPVWTERLGESATTLMLFGAGHVGRALVVALAPLPFAVRWFDAREEAFPPHIPTNATAARLTDPAAGVQDAPAGAFALVMTHDHALDLAIVDAALRRADLPFVGLIGSATKRARFERRLRAGGIAASRVAALVCPIGSPAIDGKEPAVIAASVAAQLLEARTRIARAVHPPAEREAP